MDNSMPLFDVAPSDELDASPIRASDTERRVWNIVKAALGCQHPVSINAIHRATGLGERAIKSAVSELVMTHKLMIGSRRGEPTGYFMICNAADQDAAVHEYKAQILSMLRRLRVLESPHKVREFLGQQVAETR